MDTWTKQERDFFKTLKKPIDIQNFLNDIAYDPEPECRSPRYVIKERKAHCFEGALFAAAALKMQGFKSLLVDMRAVNDDDHVIAVFNKDGCWGAIAKSNFTTLRFREPVYKSVRELVMSYFDFYFNSLGQKTMREFSVPFDLTRFDNWMTTDKDLEFIGDALDRSKHLKIMTPSRIRHLERVDKMLIDAGLLGSNPDGLFKPKDS